MMIKPNVYNRSADNSIYLHEKRFENVKEHFKQVASLLKLNEKKYSDQFSLLDIGGATGEFLYYIRTLQPDMALLCAEYSAELINSTSEFLNSHKISSVQADANNLSVFKDSLFDFVTTIGVTSIFDDFRPSFNEMIRVAKNNSVCVNSMLVNELDVDVIIKYINPSNGELESGWNKFSLKSIGRFLEQHPKVKNYSFVKHEMPFELPQRDDLMRSWTKINESGNRVLWNGLNMEISIYHIIFEVDKTS